MQTLLIALGAGVAFLIAYHTYGRWLGQKIFNLSADFVCPSHRLNDGKDYVPSPKAIVFGHHFTSIAGTGPIVGPAIAVMWGWLPALLWVVFGSIFIGAVHDLGSLVVSLRNNGQTVGDIAGRLLNKRVRLLFLFVLFMALTIVLAIFGLVIAAVFRQYPASIFPCVVQIPIAVGIGLYLHRKGKNLTIPSLIALALMYLTVAFGDQHTPIAELSWLPGWLASGIGSVESALHTFNTTLAGWSIMTWVIVLLLYCYLASVLPVWVLLQPRDYINSLQLLTALGLVVVGLLVAAMIGGAPPVEGAARQPLEIVAPAWNFHPAEAPMIFPFLFITVACGAISGFHCLVSSGTSSKQLEREPDARFVGYGAMLTEGFLATIVILACVAGLGLGLPSQQGGYSFYHRDSNNDRVRHISVLMDLNSEGYTAISGFGMFSIQSSGEPEALRALAKYGVIGSGLTNDVSIVGDSAFTTRYVSWSSSGGLARTVGAFVDGSANFLKSMGIPGGIAVALMGVLVASFAGTTLDTACRLQRYVVQELAATFLPAAVHGSRDCIECGYDLTANVSGKCPECGWEIDPQRLAAAATPRSVGGGSAKPQAVWAWANPLVWLRNKHGATLFAIAVAAFIAAMPPAGGAWSWAGAGKGGMILWPMFGATNQLLGGLAFLVIGFYLWRRSKPVWFLVLPMLFMLIMPAWAMTWQLFIGSDDQPAWMYADSPNWALIVIAAATLVLEAWMVVEAVLLWPRVKGVLEPQLAGAAGMQVGAEAVEAGK
ncbi:MAG: carbon starvation CstA family protein [Phycisphaerales bacterium]